MGLIRSRYGEILDATKKLLNLNEIGRESVSCEFPITITTGDALGKDQIVNFQTVGDDRAVLANPRRDLDSDKAPLPSRGSFRGLWPNTMCVVPVHSLELRAITQTAFDLDGLVRIVKRIQISLHREEHARRRLINRPKDGLAADHDDLSFA